MKWDDYYEKIDDWAVSTAVNKISSLEDMGTPDEIEEALTIISFKDKKGAVKLLNRALSQGVKFSGENLSEISCSLSGEESVKKALYQSADRFTAKDLEDLFGYIDDTQLAEIAKKYHLPVPKDIAEEYEEEDDSDAAFPHFQNENEEEDVSDFNWEIQAAIEAADYALQCLYQAQAALNDSSDVSFIDRMSKRFVTSLWKQETLSNADWELQIAQDALQNLNIALQNLRKNKRVQLKHERLASVIDLWFASDFIDCLVYAQINRAQKRIKQAMKQVEEIKRELSL